MTDALTPIRRAARKVAARSEALDQATAERDTAIRAALDEGARTADVVEASGLTQQRVSQIRRGARR